MPLASATRFRSPWYSPDGHSQTIWPAVARRPLSAAVARERLETSDGDFIDVAWTPRSHDRLAIISHGLEGDSRAPYAQGMAGALYRNGWDAAIWSMRGCSGEPNRLLRSYHSGMTEDLGRVVEQALGPRGYRSLALVGFSLGGNLMLKYLGEQGAAAASRIHSAVAISVPCDLAGCAAKMARWSNAVYMRRFMVSMKAKILEKARAFPGEMDLDDLARMRTFAEFDDRFTGPLNGFAGAEDYWAKCSSVGFLPRIRIPTLILNALNDPFLSGSCYPAREAEGSSHVFLDTPRNGGHVGFAMSGGGFASERRTVEFLAG